jgi:hypothetical protein
LYGCEIWYLTLKNSRLRVFESRVLRRIFEPKREEVARGWRRIHNEEPHNLFSSPNIVKTIKSREMRLAGHVARTEEKCVQNFGRKIGRERTTWKTQV